MSIKDILFILPSVTVVVVAAACTSKSAYSQRTNITNILSFLVSELSFFLIRLAHHSQINDF